MQASHRHLLGIPVRTKLGQGLGRLSDLIVDTDTGRIMAIEVRGKGWLPGILHQTFLVGWAQIVSMSDEEVIVKDPTVPEAGAPFAVNPPPPPQPSAPNTKERST